MRMVKKDFLTRKQIVEDVVVVNIIYPITAKDSQF